MTRPDPPPLAPAVCYTAGLLVAMSLLLAGVWALIKAVV
jgi:hypothetical protein